MGTRREVAEAAQVSMRTVSNVVNGHPHVSDAVRERVSRAIAEIGYRPSELARNLKAGRSGLIGLVLPELDNPYFAELTRAFVEDGARRGLTVVIDQTDGDRERERFLIDRTNSGSLFDALVISPLGMQPDDVASIPEDRPLVFLGETLFPPFDHVMIDNRAAAKEAVAHLIATGRRRIATIGAQQQSVDTSSLRLAGYADALQDAGIPYDDSLVEYVEKFRRQDGAAAMARLLALPDRPDAVFCFADPLALGALRTMSSAGIRSPEDVALVGFDDVEDGAYSTPTLTTVSPDKLRIASAALDRVMAKLGRDAGGGGSIVTVAPHQLVIRESSRPRSASAADCPAAPRCQSVAAKGSNPASSAPT
ncbi:LacI family DNA-binding transcriptional regulator [Microbacterium sp. EST19A]|uniref:LacI family DNA-binding transcriptional regulator n=1 Tax=Microbacterium sp. EST19A TaxID=2862681 RepID=UPI001CBD79FE|nr:LacI family DNA-binding transcriptional regulator [Microbacterium sp. EST19A]